MKDERGRLGLDTVDLHILSLLQENCKLSFNKIGGRIGLSAPSVIERVKKLEESGIVRGYVAMLDARKLGKDITAFVGVSINHPGLIEPFEKAIDRLEDVQECHHVTGEHTLLLKVKTTNTTTLEDLIRRIRSIDGVYRTETSVVLSTHTEGVRLDLKGATTDTASQRRNPGTTLLASKQRRGA